MKQIHDTNIIPIGTIHPIYKNIPELISGTISSQKDYSLEDSSTDFITENVKIGNRFTAYIYDNTNHYDIDYGSSADNEWDYYLNPDNSNGYYIGDIFVNSSTNSNMEPFVTVTFYYIDGTTDSLKIKCYSNAIINSPQNKKVWRINFLIYAAGNSSDTHSINVQGVRINFCAGVIKNINNNHSLTINQNCFNNISYASAPGAKLYYIIYDEYDLNKEYEYCDGQTLSNIKSPLNNKEIPCLNIGDSYVIGSSNSGEYVGSNYHVHSLSYSGEAGGNEGSGSYGDTANHTHYMDSADNRPPTIKTLYTIKVSQ